MPHEITIRKGQAHMAYARTNKEGQVVAPWHGLGKELAAPVKGAVMIDEAGLNWEVELRPAHFPHEGAFRVIPHRFATVRTDEYAALGVVGPDYRVLQNREAFQLLDDILDATEAIYETAGELRDGRRIWALARLPEDVLIAGTDRVRPYFLITNSHDGSSGVGLHLTSVRVVCMNTLLWAVRDAERSFVIRHTNGMRGRIQNARDALGITYRYFKGFEALGNVLAETKIQPSDVEVFLDRLFKTKAEESKQEETVQARNKRAEVGTIYLESPNLAAFRGTAWGLLNAAVEWFDHQKEARGDRKQEIRVERALFDPNGFKERALSTLVTLKKIKLPAAPEARS